MTYAQSFVLMPLLLVWDPVPYTEGSAGSCGRMSGQDGGRRQEFLHGGHRRRVFLVSEIQVSCLRVCSVQSDRRGVARGHADASTATKRVSASGGRYREVQDRGEGKSSQKAERGRQRATDDWTEGS